MSEKQIDFFDGTDNGFLSNFEIHDPIVIEVTFSLPYVDDMPFIGKLHGVKKVFKFDNVENPFQMMKDLDVTKWADFQKVPPGVGKKMGRNLKMRKDWEHVKNDVMMYLLRKKFSIPSLRDKLLATGDAVLVEGNWWHDCCWGVCRCKRCGSVGENRLGRLLMQIRKELNTGVVEEGFKLTPNVRVSLKDDD